MFILWKGFQSFSDVGQCMYTYVYTCMCYVRTTYVFAKRREETRRNARKQEKTSGNARKCEETDSVARNGILISQRNGPEDRGSGIDII